MFITLKSQSRKSRAKGEMEQVTTKDASTGNVVAQTHSTKRRPACVACQRRKVSVDDDYCNSQLTDAWTS